MDHCDSWLSDLLDAGGDIEAPPSPDIPLDYRAKPRRGPRLPLPSPPPTLPAHPPTKRKRAPLATISPPNDKLPPLRPRKRQQLTKKASKMVLIPPKKNPDPTPNPAPTRRNARGGNGDQISNTIQMPVRRKLGTSAVDPDPTPRTLRSRASRSTLHAAPPNAPPPQTSRRATASRNTSGRRPGRPALTLDSTPHLPPAVRRDEEEGEDDGDTPAEEPAPSISESRNTKDTEDSKKSRQRSPTRRMVDLKVADKKVTQKSIRALADIPEDVRELHKKVMSSRGIIPWIVKDDVETACEGIEAFEPSMVAPEVELDAASMNEVWNNFEALKEIQDGTSYCATENVHESTWNERVHSRMLYQVTKNVSGMSYHNITTARVMNELLQDNIYGEALKKKMVDYAITLESPLIQEDDITKRLASSTSKVLVRSINPSDYSPLCYRPILLSIETKTGEGKRETALVQLSIWVTAHFNRLRSLSSEAVGITLPLIYITGEFWQLLYATDLKDRIEIVKFVDLGNTETLLGCFKVFACLRHICDWGAETFQPWFTKNILETE